MNIMGIGPIELIVVMVIAYLVIGPEGMTSTVRSLGKVVRDLKEQTSGLPKTLDELLGPPTEEADEEPEAPGVARPRRTRAGARVDEEDDDDDENPTADAPESKE